MAVEMTSDESTPADTRTLGPSRMWLWIPALGVGALLVIAGIAVRKTEPEPDRPSADMRVTNATTITVKPGAPQWTFLKVTTVGAVGTHFTDTVPARITIDDSLASRVGVPVSGRVTSVMVELGDSVRAGPEEPQLLRD